jgi:hypothetical protein
VAQLRYIPQEGDHHTLEYFRAFGRALARAGIPADSPTSRGGRPSWYLSRGGLERNYVRFRGGAHIVGMAWPNDPGPFPRQYWSEIVPFLSDCWPDHYDHWATRMKRLRVRQMFVFGQSAAAALQDRLPGVGVHWLSEGINPDEWIAGPPLQERSLDVLELSRNYPRYHTAIMGQLEPDLSHRYSERASRTPIFPGDEALKAGLADSKIQICFPKSMTHPDSGPLGGIGAGDLEVLTQRYLEAIASGSVIVGHAPRDLVDLFGYDPVVEADMDDPVGQLRSILARVSDYQDLVDRNRVRLTETCTWDVRVAAILDVLTGAGYAVPVASA